jgi:1-acyl-sn-glycerol-3-phosphate acyltransferase
MAVPGETTVTFWKKAYGLYAWLAFTAVTLPTLGLVAVLPGEQRRRALVRGAARLLFALIGATPRLRGLANLPAEPCVVVSNHASYLDGVILTAVLPARFSFVIKREMTRVPLAHFLLRRIGSAFVERNDTRTGARDARRILRRARDRQSLAFFPEGTFTAEPGLRRFHNGAFVTALRGGSPVVPVVIRGSRAMLPAGRWLPVPGRLEVSIQPPVDQGATNAATGSLMTAARDRILEELGEPDLVH